MKKSIYVLIIIIFLCQILFVKTIFAQKSSTVSAELKLKNQAINPGDFYYSFKRIYEKMAEHLNFSDQAKLNYYQDMQKTKLEELKYVVEKKQLSDIQGASERFAFFTNKTITSLNKVKDKNKEKSTKEQFQKYKNYLNTLRDQFPSNSPYWLLVQHDINTLDFLKK